MPLSWNATDLPVEASLGDVTNAIVSGPTKSLVLTAEPGAGKSSLVPLAVANAIGTTTANSGRNNRVLMLEPRRLAARATANRLASLVGCQVGDQVGLTMRGQHSVSSGTQIEVVTEAVLTNRIQSDPELAGIGAIVFDEFHERNLHSDLGLAMAIDVKAALRPELALVVMSATLDPGPISALLGGAKTLTVPGRTFPVDIEYLQRPSRRAFPDAVANATDKALNAVAGDVLVFVPGRWEIDRTIESLRKRLSTQSGKNKPIIVGLHGGTPKDQQQQILSPGTTRRVIVATAVAETSITVPGVEAVVDGGLLRRANYDPVSGLGRLETRFATRFAADQRMGRAGRLKPGICLRLWSREDDRLLDDAVPPSIVDGDPLPVAFELARWGDPMATSLPLLDHPGNDRLAAGHQQLSKLGLTNEQGHLTKLGRSAGALPLHPRSAALVLTNTLNQSTKQSKLAILTAACLDSSRRFPTADLERAIDQAKRDPEVRQASKRIERSLAKAMTKLTGSTDPSANTVVKQSPELDEVLAGAWPDRVAMARPGGRGRFILAAGREVQVPVGDPLHDAPFLVVASADGDPRAAKVRMAVATTRPSILHACEQHITWTNEFAFDERSEKLKAEKVQRLGSIVLHRQPATFPRGPEFEAALREGIRRQGLGLFQWSAKATSVRERLAWLHEQAPQTWLAVDDQSLLNSLDDWLALGNISSPGQLRSLDLAAALLDRLDWKQRAQFPQLAPTELPIPNGGTIRVSYETGRPVWSVRLQRLLGLDEHPRLGPNQLPVTIELLSPANRPAQTTIDLPGFWRGSYQQVRTDLRGRYPKHAWPKDPLAPNAS